MFFLLSSEQRLLIRIWRLFLQIIIESHIFHEKLILTLVLKMIRIAFVHFEKKAERKRLLM